jgi:hypothetical protein
VLCPLPGVASPQQAARAGAQDHTQAYPSQPSVLGRDAKQPGALTAHEGPGEASGNLITPLKKFNKVKSPFSLITLFELNKVEPLFKLPLADGLAKRGSGGGALRGGPPARTAVLAPPAPGCQLGRAGGRCIGAGPACSTDNLCLFGHCCNAGPFSVLVRLQCHTLLSGVQCYIQNHNMNDADHLPIPPSCVLFCCLAAAVHVSWCHGFESLVRKLKQIMKVVILDIHLTSELTSPHFADTAAKLCHVHVFYL